MFDGLRVLEKKKDKGTASKKDNIIQYNNKKYLYNFLTNFLIKEGYT